MRMIIESSAESVLVQVASTKERSYAGEALRRADLQGLTKLEKAKLIDQRRGPARILWQQFGLSNILDFCTDECRADHQCFCGLDSPGALCSFSIVSMHTSHAAANGLQVRNAQLTERQMRVHFYAGVPLGLPFLASPSTSPRTLNQSRRCSAY